MGDIVERLRGLAEEWYEMCGDIHEPLGEAADEIERLREFVSGLACDCEGEQCKVYGEDYLRLDCGYRKARAALGEEE